MLDKSKIQTKTNLIFETSTRKTAQQRKVIIVVLKINEITKKEKKTHF